MQTELKPMTVATLKVSRTAEIGAFLDAGTGNSSDDILLHVRQQTAPVLVGDSVEVFLYLDPKKRLTASMRVPKIKIGQIARLKVINVTDDGAFLDAGAERGIFMPFAEMYGRLKVGDEVPARLYLDERTGRLALTMKIPAELQKPKMQVGQIARLKVLSVLENGAFLDAGNDCEIFMPAEEMYGKLSAGDKIWARLYVDKSGSFALSMKVAREIWRAYVPAENVRVGDKISGAVFEITEGCAYLFTDEHYVVSVKNFPRDLEIGQTVTARATTIFIDGSISGKILSDADKILEHIRENGGATDFNDKTEPEKIFAAFQMSKGAFKRSVGHLLKARLIEKTDGGFRLT